MRPRGVAMFGCLLFSRPSKCQSSHRKGISREVTRKFVVGGCPRFAPARGRWVSSICATRSGRVFPGVVWLEQGTVPRTHTSRTSRMPWSPRGCGSPRQKEDRCSTGRRGRTRFPSRRCGPLPRVSRACVPCPESSIAAGTDHGTGNRWFRRTCGFLLNGLGFHGAGWTPRPFPGLFRESTHGIRTRLGITVFMVREVRVQTPSGDSSVAVPKRSAGIGRTPARLGPQAQRPHGLRRLDSHPTRTSFIIRIFAGTPTT